MSIVAWVQQALAYIWKTVLIQIMAESFYEVVVDCLQCISSIPESVQVVMSSCFDDDSTTSVDWAGKVGAGDEQSLAHDAGAVSAADAAERETSFLWVQHSCCHPADLAKLHSAGRAHIGSWLPLTLLSLLPVASPPRWPSKNAGVHRKAPPPFAVSPRTSMRRAALPGTFSELPLASNAVAAAPPPSTTAPKLIRNKVLVLDLDETLIFASTLTADVLIPPDFSEVVPTMNGAELYHVWERPHLQLFLDAVSRIYNVVVFTASAPAYADPIIDRIDRGKRIRRRLYRSNCTALHWQHEAPPCNVIGGELRDTSAQKMSLSKDVALLGVPLSHVVLVDNNPCCVALHRDNGVVVPSYAPPHTPAPASSGRNTLGNKKRPLIHTARDTDDVLLGLLPFLEALACVPDVRSVIARSRQSN